MAEEITGKRELPGFSQNVIRDEEAAGLCGICLYYLLENIALTYTMASNVGVIISVAPFFTAISAHIWMKTEEKLQIRFFSALFFMDFKPDLSRFADLSYLFHIFYLGLGASAMCFVTWNFAVKVLGAVKTSVYIYMVPVITVVTSFLILKEKITPLSGTGTLLTLAGLFISEYKEKEEPGRKSK